MKYEKCPVCEEKLRSGVCPMCGYDFNRLGQSRILKDGHWDILTTDQKTYQPKYIHDEKRHPDFKAFTNKKVQKKPAKKQKYKSISKEKKKAKNFFWALAVIVMIVSSISDLGLSSQDFHDIINFIKDILSSLF